MPCCQNDGFIDRSEHGGRNRLGGSYEILDMVSSLHKVPILSQKYLLKFFVSKTHLLKRITPELIAIHELD
jgi:hypothetical protein